VRHVVRIALAFAAVFASLPAVAQYSPYGYQFTTPTPYYNQYHQDFNNAVQQQQQIHQNYQNQLNHQQTQYQLNRINNRLNYGY